MRNPYKLLRELIPEAPLQVGDVIAVSGGVATIQMPGGGQTQARGDVSVGNRVFFRNDVIEGPAPALPIEYIDV